MSESRPNRDWQPCPTGTIQNLVAREQQRRRRILLQRAGWALLIVAVPTTVVMLGLRDQRVEDVQLPVANTIHCREAIDALVKFKRDGMTLERLPEDYVDHLKHCPACRARYEAELRGRLAT